MSLKSKFTILENKDNYILLNDDCEEFQSMSITNDAENVVEYLYKSGLLKNNKRIFYIDTDYRVDELLHTLDYFDGFKSGYSNIEEFNEVKHLF